ncbi:MAG: oligosaccharide flippase family protein [Bacteroidales bacterium]|nr:oligosaccharide flippase family protein [Bacteroidales bacterium]
MFVNIKKFFFNFKNFKFVQDSVFVFLSNAILAISGILANVLIGNFYGTEGLGVFNQALAVFMIISLIGGFQITNSVLKYVSQHSKPNDKKEIFSSALIMVLLFSIIILASVISINFYFPSLFFNAEVTYATLILTFSMPLYLQNKLFLALMNGNRQMKQYASIQSLRWLLILGFIGFSIFFSKPLFFICYCFLFSEFILWSINMYFYRMYISIPPPHSVWFKKNIVFGGKSVLISFVSETNSKIDIFFISFFLSNHHVGIYSLASGIIAGLMMLPSVIQTNVSPIISELWSKGDLMAIKKYTAIISKTMLMITIPVLALAAIAYPVFVYIFMNDPEYLASLPVFYILLAGVSLRFVYYYAATYLSMANLLNIALRNAIIVLLFNALSCYLCIKFFGFLGAAISTASTFIFGYILQHYTLLKHMHIKLITNPFISNN